MKDVAILLRYLQLYAHQAHNLISGPTFFQDHEFLGELYPAYEEDYDAVIERSIGLGKPINIQEVNQSAASSLPADKGMNPKICFSSILSVEENLCRFIEKIVKGYSEGTKQMLGNIADKSEVRQYKLKQRLKA